MPPKNHPRKHQEQGFTLIELLVVIIIIGVLAAIAVPIFLNQQKAAHDAELKSDIKNVATMVETWFTKHPNRTSIADYGTDHTIQGWSIIAIGEEGLPFSGQTNEIQPPDMEPPTVSKGTTLAVVSNTAWNVGFCIYAFNRYSNYNASPSTKILLYDSTAGGLTDRMNIQDGGSCEKYKVAG